MRLLKTFIIFLCFSSLWGKESTFYSKSLQETRSYYVNVPNSIQECLHLLLFLHGAGRTHQDYLFLLDSVTQHVAQGDLPPTLVVLPYGNKGIATGSFFVNSSLFGNFEDYIIQDFIPHLQQKYPLCPSPQKRAIAGHSMGGFGAIRLAQLHPNLFSTAIAHSAPLDLMQVSKLIPFVQKENNNQRFDPSAGIYSFLAYCLSGALSPSKKQKPFNISLPFTKNWKLDTAVLQQWQQHNPLFLSKTHPIAHLYFDSGNQDRFQMLHFNRAFAYGLQQQNHPYTFEVFHGGHSEAMAQRLSISLSFLGSVWQFPQNQAKAP